MLVLLPNGALPFAYGARHGGHNRRHLTTHAAPVGLQVAVAPVAGPWALNLLGRDEQHGVGSVPHQQDLRASCPARLGAKDVPRLSQRVVCYGDSNTAGFCLGGRRFEPYGKSLAEALVAEGVPCEATICGLSGLTAVELAAKMGSAVISDVVGYQGRGLVRTLVDEGPFDLALIMAGTNDLGKFVPPDAIVEHVSRLHAACHERGVSTVALAPPTMLRGPTRAAREHLAHLLANWAHATPGVVAYFDPEELLPRTQSNGFWEPDELHLSAAGSIELGRLLAPKVLSLFTTPDPELDDAIKNEPIEAFAKAATATPAEKRHRSITPATHRLGANPPCAIKNEPIGAFAKAAIATPAEKRHRSITPVTHRLGANPPCAIKNEPIGAFAKAATATPAEKRNRSITPVRNLFGANPPCEIDGPTCFAVGSEVEVWSVSQEAWCHAVVEKVCGDRAVVNYVGPGGSTAIKKLPLAHEHLRLLPTPCEQRQQQQL